LRYETFNDCRHAESPRRDDPELTGRLQRYVESGSDAWLKKYVGAVTGQIKQSSKPGKSPSLDTPGHRPARRRGKGRRSQGPSAHVLCPDRKTFEPFLAQRLDFFGSSGIRMGNKGPSGVRVGGCTGRSTGASSLLPMQSQPLTE
jgi:hypothetical protein